ncbi:MAG: DUF4249 domain-containing protein, partial [Flavobacteriaceae bacterium]|nr:DUF4249 domain-containing protein [Flavobacteriaceae bacterium]
NNLFPGEPLPPYFIDCQLSSVPLNTIAGFSPLAEQLNAGYKYYSINESPEMEEGPYYTVPAECGNCTALGSNIVPDFWEE